MRYALLAVALILMTPVMSMAEEKPERSHRFHVTGEVAGLIRGCHVSITSSLSQKEPRFVGKVTNLPVQLQSSDFGAAFVDVTDASGDRILAVLYDRPLFQGDTDAILELNKPKLDTSIRVHRGRTLLIHHWAQDRGQSVLLRPSEMG